MMMGIKIKLVFSGLLFYLFFVLFTSVSFASSGTVNVSANVESQVSEQLSTVSSNTISTLADPAGHSILISVTLVDKDKQPLANKSVEFTSSRGEVDIIESTSKLIKLSAGSVVEPSYIDMKKDFTDNNGLVTFRLTSFVSGQAEVKIVADGIVQFSPVKANFDPLPLSMGITVVTKLPALNQELTLLSSDYNKDNLTDLQKRALSNTTPGVKIYIPIWLFALVVLGFIILLVSAIMVSINRAIIGNINEKELDILKKISSGKGTTSLKNM